MTHVTRLVPSKAMWRDLLVCRGLDVHFARRGLRGLLIMMVSPGGPKRPQDVLAMHEAYRWPLDHCVGHPDLVGAEVELWAHVRAFNESHRQVRVVLVNQFGWSRDLIGPEVPAEMDMADLRRATDIELGLAIYEPFGISPLEPLASGALCVISAASGCAALVGELCGGGEPRGVIAADFTALDAPRDIPELLAMTREERDRIEARVAAEVADRIMDKLPLDDAGRERLLREGRKLAEGMSWDAIVEKRLGPVLRRLLAL
jgi:hypothetical protein